MTKMDRNAFLSESDSGNLSLFYHFGGEYSLVPWIVNVCQFAWGEIRVIFTSFYEIQFSLTLSSLINLNCLHKPLTSCFNLKVIILQLYATSKHCWHSLSSTLASPHNTRVKKPVFTGHSTFHLQLVIGQMLISHLWEKPSNLYVYYKSIFFSNLAWSKSQGVYYKPTCIHMHFKDVGPSKTYLFLNI